jgi:hypothetical protein
MTTFVEVIKQWARIAPANEVLEIREYFQGLPTNQDLIEEVQSVRHSQGYLASIKHVKMRTGWDLKRSKEYVDSLY